MVSNIIAGDELDNSSFRNGIKINVCMGRHAGWIAAATSLAKYRLFEGVHHRPDYGPHLIYTPEIPFSESRFIQETQQVYDRLGRVTIVVAEGVADSLLAAHAQGERDEFGNAQLSGSGKLGDYLGELVEKNIQERPELGKLRVRCDTWGYLQRSIPGLISPVDQSESFWVGAMAVRYAMQGETDKMVTLIRKAGDRYTCETGLCDLEEVAQKTKTVPREFFNAQGNGMSEAFIRYAEPLAGVLPEVSVLNAPLLPSCLPAYNR